MNKVMTWVSKMLSEADGTPSSKRFAFIFTVGLLGGVTLALTVITCTDPKLAADALKSALTWFASSGALGYVGGKAADNLGGKRANPPDSD